jgi:hypothetical protein
MKKAKGKASGTQKEAKPRLRRTESYSTKSSNPRRVGQENGSSLTNYANKAAESLLIAPQEPGKITLRPRAPRIRCQTKQGNNDGEDQVTILL